MVHVDEGIPMRLVLLVLVLLCAVPAAAEARMNVAFEGDTLVITGDDAADDLTLSIRDREFICGRPAPCLNLNGNVAAGALDRCTFDGILETCDIPARIVVRLGGGDDRLFLLHVPVPLEAYGGPGDDEISGGDRADRIYGEAGDDELVGGLGDDLLDGGEGRDEFESLAGSRTGGADTIVGGPGPDHVMYWQRSSAVSVTLDGVANDGEAGERDNVGSDVEFVYGSDHDDTLIGDDSPNVLIGGSGDDTIHGLGGDDRIEGDAEILAWGDDKLYGGSGDDEIWGRSGSDLIDGGPGGDKLVGDDPCLDQPDGSVYCPAGAPGNDTIVARDGEVDEVQCGRLHDSVIVDAIDRVTHVPIGFHDVCEQIDGAVASSPQPATPSGPVATVLDARKRAVVFAGARLTGGRFRTGVTIAGITDIELVGAAKCKRNSRAVVRKLTVARGGKVRTVGAVAATMTNANGSWTITDRCDGTIVKVTKGTARVTTTTGRRKTTTVKAGRSLHVKARPRYS